ncbi:hypothetical protein SG34_008725 [Thalassomonas viridans]|uniref:Uncharacterized protein n=1 Tax=Thalassomonas viridans TaxID=137584 RepID=A0AAE9Z5C8_9GAMM|nr:hypothetical protein [Thalassomonas viridans]WDE06955.1 hypothetical protein SG34_008725 [Thalassomonas viridans]
MTDHFEPGSGKVSEREARERVDRLLREYPVLADKHKDSEGLPPKRTWFIPPHYHKNYYLRDVVSLCEQGYGEVELHLHHGKHCPDTSDNLRETIRLCVDEYSKLGIFGKENGQPVYGFIHGDWALDNARDNKFCGVNDEIKVLKETGCYADFTFPSPNQASPEQINSIFYAKEDPDKPKSHNTGERVRVRGDSNPDDLMIIQGPTYPYFRDNELSKLRAAGDEIAGTPPLKPNRIDACIRSGIAVKGKEDWIFVKMHTHGATDADAVLGQEMDDIFTYLESQYNDGKHYCLHYVTARETYNLIKAIEQGEKCQDPALYRNYLVSAPKYDSAPDIAAASEALQERVARTYKDEINKTKEDADIIDGASLTNINLEKN